MNYIELLSITYINTTIQISRSGHWSLFSWHAPKVTPHGGLNNGNPPNYRCVHMTKEQVRRSDTISIDM